MRGSVLSLMIAGDPLSSPMRRQEPSDIRKKSGPPESPRYSPSWLPVVA